MYKNIYGKDEIMSKKILALALCLLACLSLLAGCTQSEGKTVSSIKQAGELVVATSPDFPPFENIENGEITGIEIEIAQLICDELGVDLRLESMDFDSVLLGVQAGKYDCGIAGISVDEDRQKNMLFTNPYCLAAQSIIVPAGSEIDSKADLTDRTIAVQTGTTAEKYCMANGYNILAYINNADAQTALTTGKVDAWVIDDLTGYDMVGTYNETNESKLVILSEAMTSEPYAFAFSFGSEELVESINKIMNDLVTDGTVAAIFAKYDAPYTQPDIILTQGEQFIDDLTAPFQKWLNKLHETFIEENRYQMLLDGLGNTFVITLGALVVGVIIGTVIAIGKYFSEGVKALKPVEFICDLYVTVIRGVPVVVLLLIFYYVILASANEIAVGIITFGINSGAYMAELIRSGINAVDKGQMEAGRSLGMSKMQTMSKIILPQAVRYILPAIGNELIALLKETSVAGYIAVVDLTRAGNLIRNNTFDAINPLLVVALTYLVIVIALTQILGAIERRLAKNDKR